MVAVKNKMCAFCGSVKTIPEYKTRHVNDRAKKIEKFFCDNDCYLDYKRTYKTKIIAGNEVLQKRGDEKRKRELLTNAERERTRKAAWTSCAYCWRPFQRKSITNIYCSELCNEASTRLNMLVARTGGIRVIECINCGESVARIRNVNGKY